MEECYQRGGGGSSYTKLDFVFHTDKGRICQVNESTELILFECVLSLRLNNVPDSIFVRICHFSFGAK